MGNEDALGMIWYHTINYSVESDQAASVDRKLWGQKQEKETV